MNKIKSRMEQAKHKKYYGQRKTRIGNENLNAEHRQEYEEEKNMKRRNIIQRKKNRNVGIQSEGI
jgi:hypothetical protein